MNVMHRLIALMLLVPSLCVPASARSPQVEPVALEASPEGNADYELEERLVVSCLEPGRIQVDGDLSDWEDIPPMFLEQTLDHAVGRLKEGMHDAALLRFARDEDALYFAIRVVDGSIVEPVGFKGRYKGDVVELFLDVRPVAPAEGRKLGDPDFSDGVHRLVFDPPRGKGKEVRWMQVNEHARIGDFEVTGRLVEGGYTLEIRMPYASFPGVPASRFPEPIGFDILINDTDVPPDGKGLTPPAGYSLSGRISSESAAGFVRAVSGTARGLPQPYLVVKRPRRVEIAGEAFVKAALVTSSALEKPRAHIELGFQHSMGAFEQSFKEAMRIFWPGMEWKHPHEPRIATTEGIKMHDYQPLGLRAYVKSLKVEDLAPGRYVFEASFPGLALGPVRSLYYAGAWGPDLIMDFVSRIPKDEELAGEMAKVLPSVLLDSHYVIDQAEIRGAMLGMSATNVMWRLSELAEAGRELCSYKLYLADEVGDRVAWQEHFPLDRCSFDFSIPVGDLPKGKYVLDVVVIGADGSEHSIAQDFDGMVLTAERAVVVMDKREVVLATTCEDAAEVLTEILEIGSPNRERFPKDDAADCFARSVWDLFAYEGRIYVGCGDANRNRGPIDIWSFGPVKKGEKATFEKEYTVGDESVNRFRAYDEMLLVPGIDAKGGWELGNLYIKSGGKWLMRRTVPNGIHVFDAAVLAGKLYVTTGTETGAALFESADNGKSWTRIEASEKIPARHGRFYEMIPFGDGLFIMPSLAPEAAYYLVGGTLERVFTPVFPPHAGARPGWKVPWRLERFGGGVLYTISQMDYPEVGCQPLFFMSDLSEGAYVLEQFQNDRVRDIVVREEMCYVLTACEVEEGFEGFIYGSADLRAWTRLARFTVPAVPNSVELLDDVFYVALSSRSFDAEEPASGSIWMVVR